MQTATQTETVNKPAEIYPYTKAQRFAVARRLPKDERFRANFKFLHDSKESAETEAKRLAAKYNEKFYVVEIRSIATNLN